MAKQFQCENCEAVIELDDPVIVIGSKVECPICFTLHIVKDVKSPKLEIIEGDSTTSTDAKRIVKMGRTPKKQTDILSSERQYLCIPFNGITNSGD